MSERSCTEIPIPLLAALDRPLPWRGGVRCGPSGVGKSFQALRELASITEDPRPPLTRGDAPLSRFLSIPLYVELLREIAVDDSDPRWIQIEKIRDAEYLVADDLGAEKLNDFASGRLYLLFDHRWARKLPTVVTTNCEPASFQSTYGDRLWSRISSFGPIIELAGRDRRTEPAPEPADRPKAQFLEPERHSISTMVGRILENLGFKTQTEFDDFWTARNRRRGGGWRPWPKPGEGAASRSVREAWTSEEERRRAELFRRAMEGEHIDARAEVEKWLDR